VVRDLRLWSAVEGENAVRVTAAIRVDGADRFEPCCEWAVDHDDASVSIREERCDALVLASTDTAVVQEATVECADAGTSDAIDVTIAAVP